MSGTKAGGKKAATTNQERHGADFYSRIAKLRQTGSGGRFGQDKEYAAAMGRLGGKKSKRGSKIHEAWLANQESDKVRPHSGLNNASVDSAVSMPDVELSE